MSQQTVALCSFTLQTAFPFYRGMEDERLPSARFSLRLHGFHHHLPANTGFPMFSNSPNLANLNPPPAISPQPRPKRRPNSTEICPTQREQLEGFSRILLMKSPPTLFVHQPRQGTPALREIQPKSGIVHFEAGGGQLSIRAISLCRGHPSE
jgi:hypothetical protein